MKVTKERKREIFKNYSPQNSEIESGSPQSQIALFTNRINHLTEHLSTNKKDHSSRLSLIKMVGKRKRMIKYLKDNDSEAYSKIISSLSLRK
jgi:small subunit ribosomal protein S15